MSKIALLCCLVANLCLRSLAYDPAPIPVPAGTEWYGDDGNWSPVNIRVGSPPQWLSVYPNTAGQETWVIGPGGCDGTSTCQQERGGLFSRGQSTTWTTLGTGYYELNFDAQLGDTGYAFYGLDNLDLSDQVSVPSQIVAILNTTEFWLGSLGLGIQSSRFEGTMNHLTFLSSLVETAGLIPSHSYGYTAGAYYQLKHVPASLTLGGVDTNRFVPNPATFTLGPNAQPVVAINSIKVSSTGSSLPLNWTSNPLTLQDTSEAELHSIDSSTPFLWLPEYVCDSFAQAFNLTYDDHLQLYLFGDDGATLNDLRSQNITITFSIADSPGSSNAVDISLPYAAFDLALSFPYPGLDANVTSGSINYFPLRRAANYTQYTIGRSFLQEAYLTVDYERNNFSVSQATFAEDSLTNINLVPITRPANSNFTGPAGFTGQSTGLSTGAKAGIGAAAAALVISFIGLLVYIFIVRKKRGVSKLASESDDTSFMKVPELLGDVQHSTPPNSARRPMAEVLGDRRHPTEMVADSTNTRFEMAGTHAFEMPAGEVPTAYLDQTKGTGPAELENTVSDLKHPDGPPDRRASSIAPPAYPHPQDDGQPADSISPNSPNRSAGAFGTDTVSSGEQGISPVGGAGSADRTSDQVLSPISPNNMTMEFPKTLPTAHYKLRGAGSRTENVGALLAPQPQDDHPSRSPSRGSRFVEDLDADQTKDQNSSTPTRRARPERKSSDRKRFSWEE